MVTIKKNARTIRETTCEFEYQDGDKLKTEKIRVRYYSPTTADQRKLKTERDENGAYWLSDMLVDRLESLPDLIDEETGKPFVIEQEFLDGLDVRNINAINQAIQDDLNPKLTPDSSQNG